jgi:MFS transporter, CP family, cyanate transporter
MRRIDPAWVVVLAGVTAALHVGKLPPALPVLRETLDLSLLQAGFLLSLVQLAGMTLGLAVGLAADGLGLKRSMVSGLLILFGASAIGGWAQGAGALLGLRAIEGFGFLLASMPAPSLIRQLVSAQRLNAMLGLWGAYMPLGTALALLCGPLAITAMGWRVWWWLLSAMSLAMALWMAWVLPPDRQRALAAAARNARGESAVESWQCRLRATLAAPGPWLVALTFAMYSGQWLAVIGFLPSIYAQAGVSAALGGVLTAFAALVNVGGNIASGRLLQRGWPPQALLWIGFGAMAMGAAAAFATLAGVGLPPAVRYLAVLLFSMMGGMIPATLFSLAVTLAPGATTVSTTVGWAQQWSALGQFAGPPLVAWIAGIAGGWQWTWVVTGVCAVGGAVLAQAIARLQKNKRQAQTSSMQVGTEDAAAHR